MSSRITALVPSANGVPRKPVSPARKPARRSIRNARRIAGVVGGIGVGALSLSVHHCSESIAALTGSGWVSAGLLAVAIDAGMVACEVASVAGRQRGIADRWVRWAEGYVLGAVALSVLLNGYAYAQHAPAGMEWASWLLGACVPSAVYALGRVACGLWLSSEE